MGGWFSDDLDVILFGGKPSLAAAIPSTENFVVPVSYCAHDELLF
jgi:hypothetical protein